MVLVSFGEVSVLSNEVFCRVPFELLPSRQSCVQPGVSTRELAPRVLEALHGIQTASALREAFDVVAAEVLEDDLVCGSQLLI